MGSKTVKSRILVCRAFVLLVLAANAWSAVPAGELEKKFRLGLAVGGMNAQDDLLSDAGNIFTLVDDQQQFEHRYMDPRSETGIFGKLEIKPGAIATLYGQYGLNSWFLIEASVGYQRTDLGDAEVQGQINIFPSPDPTIERHNFLIKRVPVGNLTRIPIQLTALAHFRPHASFDPYCGVGIGYSVVGFDPSPAFNELSRNMDASRGSLLRLTNADYSDGVFLSHGANRDLIGATVDARDTFEWHIAGGAELAFKRRWSAFIDMRYLFGSRDVTIGFNGGKDLGIAVPNLVDYFDPNAEYIFGAVQITDGGLIDFGGLYVLDEDGEIDPAGCVGDPADCEFQFHPTPDGYLDLGRYYVQGGTVKYDAVSLQVGIRLTF
jgi:hypothetical protein